MKKAAGVGEKKVLSMRKNLKARISKTYSYILNSLSIYTIKTLINVGIGGINYGEICYNINIDR
jgi:hypothetical protein